jgi:type I restriction enzyme S subunit
VGAELHVPNGWRVVRFDQMADSITERVDDPSEAGVEHYVGLEHLDPESLKIRRWGAPDDVAATKLRFQPGDIIFGRRRAYQRKLAVAEFEGICSAHALVLRAREDVVAEEFLPFFMQSEVFFERALSISVGSLSPTINWKTLAQQKFAVPPIEEQRRIAEVLWAADDLVQQHNHTRACVENLQASVLEEFLTHASTAGWSTEPVGKLLSERPSNGLSPKANAAGKGFPTLSLSAVRGGRIIPEGNTKYATVTNEQAKRYRLERDDILVVRGNGNKSLTGRCGRVTEVPEGCFYPDLLIRLRFDPERIRPAFAAAQWNIPSVHQRLISRAKSTNGIWKINGQDIRAHELTVPPLKVQDTVLAQLDQLDDSAMAVIDALERTDQLKKSLLAHMLQAG